MKKKSMLAINAFLSLIAGFFLQIAIIGKIGVGQTGDAILSSAAIPQYMVVAISGALIHVLVPIFSMAKSGERTERHWGYLNLVFISITILVGFLIATSESWMQIIATGYDDENVTRMLYFTKIQLIGAIIAISNSVMIAKAHADEKFILPEIANLTSTSICLVSIGTGYELFGLNFIAYVTTVRAGTQSLILLTSMGSPKQILISKVDFLYFVNKLKSLTLGNVIYKSEGVIDRALLGGDEHGSIVIYHTASQIYAAGIQVVNVSIKSPLLQKLSILRPEVEQKEYWSLIYKTMAFVAITTALSIALFLIKSDIILKILFGRKGFSEVFFNNLSETLLYLSAATLFSSLALVTSATYYARAENALLTKISIINYGFGLVLKYLLTLKFGLLGLCIANGIYIGVGLFLQLVNMRKWS